MNKCITFMCMLLSILMNYIENIPNQIVDIKLAIPEYRLVIPSIDFDKEFNNKSTLKDNIELLPSTTKDNIVIAGHSGVGSLAYFKNLHKVRVGDEIVLYHWKIKKRYIVDLVYDVDKTGEISIRKDSRKNTITLITCIGKNKQRVVIANLVQ